MLFLILAHGHIISLIYQDIRGHEHGVRIDPQTAISRAFLFVLYHSIKPMLGSNRTQNPTQLHMLLNFWLNEHASILFDVKVDPTADHVLGYLHGIAANFAVVFDLRVVEVESGG